MIYLVIAVYLIVVAVLLLWQFSNLYSAKLGAPAISSPRHELWKEFSSPNKTFLDLGCGVGSVLLRVSPHFKHVYGIEYSPWYYLVSKLRTRKRANITVCYGNFFTLEWPPVDYIYCYLLPGVLEHLKPRLAKSRATVLSYAFPIPGWPAKRVVKQDKRTLYVYS